MGVAQLAEHRTVAPTVAGSIPVSHPNSSLLLRNILFRNPRSGLADVLMLSLLLELSRFLHELPGAVCEGFGPFAFLAGLLASGQFALCHKQSLPQTRALGYPLDYKLPVWDLIVWPSSASPWHIGAIPQDCAGD